MYISAAGCYSLDMNWAGGSWRIIFPAGLVSATMETATANALSTATGTPTAVTPGATVECNNPPIPLDSLFEATETALPPQPTGLAGQTPLPNPTFAPISVDQLQQRCPSPINLTVSPIPVCPTSANGLVPTASPTAAALGSVRVDCLPLGKNLYIQVCPATVPLSNSLMFRGVLGPPFPTCAATSQPYRSPTLAFSETPSAMPDPIASVTFNSGTATPMTK